MKLVDYFRFYIFSRSRVWCSRFAGLKARHITAQGNALGKPRQMIHAL